MIGKTTHRSAPPIPIDLTTGLLSPSSPAMSASSDNRPTARDMNRNGPAVTLKTAIAVSAENTKAIMATNGCGVVLPAKMPTSSAPAPNSVDTTVSSRLR